MTSDRKKHPLEELGLSANVERPLKSLFVAIGLDENVPGYRDIVEAFEAVLEEEVELPPNLEPFWSQGRFWFEGLWQKREYLDPTDTKNIEKSRKKFGLLAGIIFNAPPEIETRFNNIKQLLLCMLFVLNSGPAQSQKDFLSKLATTGSMLYGARETGGQLYEVVSSLPAKNISLEYLLEIQYKAETWRKRFAGKKRAVEFVNNINFFSWYLLQTRMLGERESALEENLDQDLKEGCPVLSLKGEGSQISSQFPPYLVDEPLLELSIQESADSFNSDSEGPVPFAELERQARRTNFLGRQWQPPSPWEFGSISPIEWPFFVEFLDSLPDWASREEGAAISPELALAVALQAATSWPLERLVELEYGVGGDIDPNGWWHRRVPPPENAFSPPSGSEHFLETETEFQLPLPGVVQRLMGHWFAPSPKQKLGPLLGITGGPEDLSAFRQEMGELLRQKVSGRLRVDHLRTALRHQIHSVTECEVTTYCLIGDPTKSIPPVGLFYYSLPVAELKTVYRDAVGALFPETPQ